MMTSDSWCSVIITSGITDMAFSNALKFSSVLIHYKTLKLQLTPSGSDYLLFCFWCHNLACFQYSCSPLNKCLYVVCASVYMPLCACVHIPSHGICRGQRTTCRGSWGIKIRLSGRGKMLSPVEPSYQF